jgi:predicted GNAT family acetyltransferase
VFFSVAHDVFGGEIWPEASLVLVAMHAARRRRYRLVIDGVEAEMTYSRAGDGLIIIDHTEIPVALRGRKVGERLVRQAIDDARREKVAIVPLCPFAKAQFDRHPEWRDVLRQSKN